MPDILRSLILGVIQGLTEFLPVSSSGHLEIINQLLGSSESVDSDLTMVVLVHAGTALSILYIFRNDIIAILKDFFSFRWTEHTKLAMLILLSMIPAMILGLLFEEQIEAAFQGGIWKVGIALICTGLILWITPDLNEVKGLLTWKTAILIGVAQAIAVMPGISRSGMTIAAALLLGIGKKDAARFSFLMVLPVILGKLLLDVLSGEFSLSGSSPVNIGVAFLSSFVVGVFACRWMIELVQRSNLRIFAYYCVILGLFTIGLSIYGI